MKKLFISLGAWIRSFFVKKSKPIEIESVLTQRNTEAVCNPYVKKEQEELLSEPQPEENLLDLQESEKVESKVQSRWKPEHIKTLKQVDLQGTNKHEQPSMSFDVSKNKILALSTGETFEVTEKQMLFYDIIKYAQEKQESVSGNLILEEFFRKKFSNLSIPELNKILSKQTLSSHGKTTKGMFKSGLLIKVARNKYRVKI